MARKESKGSKPHEGSPFNEEIYQAWHAIAFARDLSVSERVSRWTPLFEKHWNGETLSLPSEDAGLITVLGTSLMMQAGEFRRARELCDIFLSLPDALEDEMNLNFHLVHRGLSLILEGNVEQGVSQLRELLDKGAIVLVQISGGLHESLYENLSDDTFVQVRSFAADLCGAMPKCKELARSAAEASSHEELQGVLENARKLVRQNNQGKGRS